MRNGTAATDRWLACGMIAALIAGCAETPQNAAETSMPDNSSLQLSAADGGPSYGRYRATDAKGEILIEELQPDGSYTFRSADGTVIEEGNFEQKSQSELCFTADTDGAAETCYDEAVGDDGIWRSTDESGAVYKIERLD